VATGDLDAATDSYSGIDVSVKYTVSILNLDRNGDNEAFVVTFVATETML
jgi:hypothetical protein